MRSLELTDKVLMDMPLGRACADICSDGTSSCLLILTSVLQTSLVQDPQSCTDGYNGEQYNPHPSSTLFRNSRSIFKLRIVIFCEEVEQQGSLFCELLHLDPRLVITPLGRPPKISIKHMDTRRPSYIPGEGCSIWESSHHQWKHCVTQPSSVLESLYATVLDLDRRIRDFLIPALLRYGETQSSSIVLQKASLGTTLVDDRCFISLKSYAIELLPFFFAAIGRFSAML
ncbi:hypothetical protein K443DRAFT_437751 [Laccaria amethystina LaAM-08-1]|uniref:Uncharacterized protein n=1 Tax=Laccaria amethystina LaAM-08-1 TaxID=1095629 RepID=A0A0C9XR21_9AGAR|nr:hypothetical protein K443DRAFT_437751 [Laccaria amethystina LaAM-08-1]